MVIARRAVVDVGEIGLAAATSQRQLDRQSPDIMCCGVVVVVVVKSSSMNWARLSCGGNAKDSVWSLHALADVEPLAVQCGRSHNWSSRTSRQWSWTARDGPTETWRPLICPLPNRVKAQVPERPHLQLGRGGTVSLPPDSPGRATCCSRGGGRGVCSNVNHQTAGGRWSWSLDTCPDRVLDGGGGSTATFISRADRPSYSALIYMLRHTSPAPAIRTGMHLPKSPFRSLPLSALRRRSILALGTTCQLSTPSSSSKCVS